MGRLMRTIQKALKEGGGFTLLEAMIALSILSVGLLSLVGMFISAMDATARGGQETQAVQLAQMQIEEFKNTKYDNIPVGVDIAAPLQAGGPVSPMNALGTNDISLPNIFTRTYTVTEDVANEVLTITVTVSWRDHEISLTTMLYTQT